MGVTIASRLVLLGVVLALLGRAPAAAGAPVRVAVMPVEGAAPAALAEQVAAALAEAGRTAGREVVRPAVPLDEVRLTVDCPEASDACTAVVGRNLGVDELVLTRITRQGDGWQIEVTRFGVNEGQPARRLERRLGGAPASAELAGLGAELFTAPVALAPAGPPPPARRFTVRPRTWITGAGGAALLVAAGVCGGLAKSAQHDLDTAALPAPGDRTAIRHFVDLADRGRAYALSANVLFGLGGAALAAAGVLLYLDNRRVEVLPTRGGLALSLGGSF